MPTVTIWVTNARAALTPMAVATPLRVTEHGVSSDDASPPGARAAALFVPARSAAAPAGVLLVPDELALPLALNGVRARAGAHLLQHADRVDLGATTFWFSTHGEPVHASYDPDAHGTEVYCARTRARLEPGEPIVICPGTPSTTCGAIYREVAWQAGIPCHQCRYALGGQPWQPPAPVKRRSLDALLELARGNA